MRAQPATSRSSFTWFTRRRRLPRVWRLAGVDLLLLGVLWLAAPGFASRANLQAIGNNMALEALLLGPLTLLLVVGMFDLSVDGVAALAGVVAGVLLTHGTPVLVGVAGGLAVGLLGGGLNGLLVTRLRINPLIATLGTLWLCTGLALGLTKGVTPYGFPAAFQVLGQTNWQGWRIGGLYGIVVLSLCAFVLAWTRTGAHIYVVGDNAEAARMMGVPAEPLRLSLYLVMGLTAAWAGLTLAARLDASPPNAIDGMALRVIAAAVIGGCSLSGGKGTVLAGLLGLLTMSLLTNGAVLLGISPYWQRAIIGGVLLAAMVSQNRGER